MIKTATPSATQDSAKEAEYSGNMKQVVDPAKTISTESKVTQSKAKQASAEISDTYTAESIYTELEEINQKLKAWQDRVNELLNDPNNADKIVNLLNSIQYMINRRAELKILQRQFMTSTNGYTFQDHQSILHAGSVRRKDAEALKITERSR